MGAVGSAFAIIFGIFWTVFAYSLTRESPFPLVGFIFPLFGVLFVGMGVFQLIYNLKNTVSKDRYSVMDITESGEESDPLERRFGRPAGSNQVSIETRLRTLEDLKNKGLISHGEYETRRAKIIEQV